MVTAARLNQLIGNSTEAYGANPSDLDKIYKFKYKIVDLDDLIPSHTDTLTPNPNYPQELQPRLRDRAASKAQIDGMAQNLNPRVLLTDTGFLDTGPMIVGSDDVVESGNGRVLALRKAANEGMSRYNLYKNMLVNNADKYGIPSNEVEKIKHPVLVRERITDVNRVEFARDANQGAVMGMSPFEQALVDSQRLSDNIINTMQVSDEQTIDQALKTKANDHIVNHYLQTIPTNERATLSDSKGSINQQGMQRLKMAIFAKTYPGESGQRLTRTFSESVDPLIRNVENAMFQSLPDMAKAESLIVTGKRENDMSISKDLAEAIDTYARLKQTDIKTSDYLKQSHMFNDELTPFQMQILEHLDTVGQRPKLIREFLREAADKIVNAPAKGQTGMLGGYEAPSKEELVNGIINRQRKELGREVIPTATTTSSKGLEKPNTAGDQSAKGMGSEVSKRVEPDKPPEPSLAAHTSVQTGLAGFDTKPQQMQAFSEFGGGGRKESLVDVEKLKAAEDNKPLPGQIDFITGKTVEGKSIISDVTPKGYGVEEGGDTVTPQIEKIKGETTDEATNREVGYQIDNGRVKLSESVDGWKATVTSLTEEKPHVIKAFKKQDVLNETWKYLNPDYTETKKSETTRPQTAASIPEKKLTELRATNQERKQISIIRDNKAQNKITIEHTDPLVKQWEKHPGNMDVLGVDTPPNITKASRLPNQRAKGITSRGTGITSRSPRITQRRPRIR